MALFIFHCDPCSFTHGTIARIDLAHLGVRLGLFFTDGMFAAIDNGNAISDETHFRFIQSAIMSGAWAFLVLQFIGFREALTVG